MMNGCSGRRRREKPCAIGEDQREDTRLFAQIETLVEARRTCRVVEQAQFEILARLASAAEFPDDETGAHTRRVGDLSVIIAQRLRLPAPQVELIGLAAPLHDIGKIAVSDAVLRKPGKLTSNEFEHMKTHTTVGARMLAGGGPFALLGLAEQIALTHHEKWDGSGYPAGLVGDEIPIAGRIVAVADVFDALTHARPYKTAWRPAAAIAEMTTQAEPHFDPQTLAVFSAFVLGQTGCEPVAAQTPETGAADQPTPVAAGVDGLSVAAGVGAVAPQPLRWRRNGRSMSQ